MLDISGSMQGHVGVSRMTTITTKALNVGNAPYHDVFTTGSWVVVPAGTAYSSNDIFYHKENTVESLVDVEIVARGTTVKSVGIEGVVLALLLSFEDENGIPRSIVVDESMVKANGY